MNIFCSTHNQQMRDICNWHECNQNAVICHKVQCKKTHIHNEIISIVNQEQFSLIQQKIIQLSQRTIAAQKSIRSFYESLIKNIKQILQHITTQCQQVQKIPQSFLLFENPKIQNLVNFQFSNINGSDICKFLRLNLANFIQRQQKKIEEKIRQKTEKYKFLNDTIIALKEGRKQLTVITSPLRKSIKLNQKIRKANSIQIFDRNKRAKEENQNPVLQYCIQCQNNQIVTKIKEKVRRDTLDLYKGLNSNAQFKQIEHLHNQNNLVYLYLNNNQIVNLEPLIKTQFPNLQTLRLPCNQISNLEPLVKVKYPSLETLSLASNLIVNIQPLSRCNFPLLKDLSLYDNQIKSIESLTKFEFQQLVELNLHHNQIQNLYPLSRVQFINIKRIILHNNKFTGDDISTYKKQITRRLKPESVIVWN